MNWRQKKVVVIGAARSGLAAAKYLAERGAEVWLNDLKERSELPAEALTELEERGVRLVLGQHVRLATLLPQLVIVSPGVPFEAPPLVEAREKQIPVWSEIELAARVTRAPIVAVTGTNGKTTTTCLLEKIFRDADYHTFTGGNIGTPFISKAEELTAQDLAVLEVSSFQLATTEEFHPHVAIILNITPDHLDRHYNLEGYIAAKAKIFAKQTAEDWLILNWDDEETVAMAARARTNVLFFSRIHILDKGFYVDDGWIIAKVEDQAVPIVRVEDLQIKGGHNVENALAATAAAWVMGVAASNIADSLRTFQPVAHRLEPVLTYRGVRYINDSKGTNPDAAIKALDAFSEGIVLIAGGKSKGSDFLPFAWKIKEKVKALVLVGEAAPEIDAVVRKVGYQNVHYAESFVDAVHRASELAEKGDIVLLSPACASFDMFTDYEQRGDVFKELVRQLAKC
ncbi:MAG TPA: UDP-N-acetylmuramoyl-L-alanine--D-glutamate ligase [Peptococcaceae bacterium]|jgi:UDP-N-acetylmuramoylalanine--D-glutamate ligase|nr:UDP-N-acetylmuramoyl-L-alanine--D-glutamate ligase [Clostridia bacterium]HOB81815.1 UDP-N-acetylmuramoyl-L-alanine--D-glutamate ligase [Peptococcaceae bacterium]HQD53721.1 UDP-N-acetylmuramoyl-L-alanine--D-glutamate ligase [Peptococcaceae bacterium]